MPFTIYWRLANGGSGTPGPVNTVTSAAQSTGDWAVVSGIPADTDIQYSLTSNTGPWTSTRTLPAPTVPAGRVPAVTTAPGGRPNVRPPDYHIARRGEFVDPATHPHIMGVTIRTAQSGRYTDASTWNLGRVPIAGDVVAVSAGHVLIANKNDDVILKDLLIEMGGTFRLPSTPTRWRLDTFMNMGNLILDDRTEHPTAGMAKHEFIWHPSEAPGISTRLGLNSMGPTRIHGAPKKGHLRATNVDIAAGVTRIPITGLGTANWRVGDKVVILGTNYVAPTTTDATYTSVIPAQPTTYYDRSQRTLNEFQPGQDEERTITAVTATYIDVDAPLEFAHNGMTGTLPQGQTVTVRPVIMNLSRSIRFRSASAAEDGAIDPNANLWDLQKRGVMMFMGCPDIDTRYFECKNMGRTFNGPSLQVDGLPIVLPRAGGTATINPIRATSSTSSTPLADPQNVRGRYAGPHYHWCGGPYNASPLVVCLGASVWAPIGSGPAGPGWGITQHGSRMSIEDCAVSNIRGAGMVSELGNETGQWLNNCVTGCRGNGDRDFWGSSAEYYDNLNGAVGVAYENQSRAIIMHGNVAGSSKYAMLWHAQKSNMTKRSPRDIDLRLMDPLTKAAAFNAPVMLEEEYAQVNVQIPPILDTDVFACRFGFSVIHRQGDGRHLDKTPMLMERYNCVNVPFAWEVPEYSNTYYVKDFLMQAPPSMSSSVAINLGNVTWDWVFSNGHIRRYGLGIRDSGAGLNYEGAIIDVTYSEVTTEWSSPFLTVAGDHPSRDVMGPWVENPSTPGEWRIRSYASVASDAAGLAQLRLYPLAPYGRKMPAGSPVVNPGGTPYFVLGDGVNGAASTDPVAINLTLTAGTGRNQGRLYGIIRDSIGDRRYPDFQTSETFPTNVFVKSHRTLGAQTPEQFVERHGCWNDNGTWRVRTWFHGADRLTHVRFSWSVDWTLAGFNPAFLATHDIGGPQADPGWPDEAEAIPAHQPPLRPVVKAINWLSPARGEAISGRTLSLPLVVDDPNVRFEIVAGGNANLFRISSRTLQWFNNGSRASGTYTVTVRATDVWGNTSTQAHTIVVTSALRLVESLNEPFTYADGPLEGVNPNYVMLNGTAGAFSITNNRMALASTTAGQVIELANVGVSDMDVRLTFINFQPDAYFLFRMVDADNWLGIFRTDLSGGLFRMAMCVGGTISILAEFPQLSNAPFAMLLRDRKFQLRRYPAHATIVPDHFYPRSASQPTMQLSILTNTDPLFEPATLLLPENAPRGTLIGARTATATRTEWVDNVSVTPLAPQGVAAATTTGA